MTNPEGFTDNFFCTCTSEYTGNLCQSRINFCNSAPCNNGNCNPTIGGYECDCTEGFDSSNPSQSKYCDININDCASNPCKNDAICRDFINRFSCICKPGWTGTICDIDLRECYSDPCQNGYCLEQVDAYQCVCDFGFYGVDCELDILECESEPCRNGGQSSYW